MSEKERPGARTCVIGAGVTGLVAACSLARSGFAVTVLESELRPGGMLSSFRIGWEDLERIPHRVDAGDRAVLDLFRDLGLDGQIEWFRPSAALYLDGAHHRIDRPSDLLRIGAAPLAARIRAALSARGRGGPPDRCEDSLRALLSHRSGRRGIPPEWASCRSGRRAPPGARPVGYPSGGFSVLVRTLLKEIEARGGEVRCGCTVTDIRPRGGGFRLECILEDCSAFDFDADAVVATVSGRRFAEMSAGAGIDDALLDPLRAAGYLGHLCLALRMRTPLSPYHRTLVPDDSPFRLVTEHTELVGQRRYGGHIVYLSRDVDTADPLWTEPDGDIFRLFFRSLGEMHPGILRSDVKDWRLTRTRYSCPTAGPAPRGPAPSETVGRPGLYLASLARTVAEERSLERSVRAGLAVADKVRGGTALRSDGVLAPNLPQREVH